MQIISRNEFDEHTGFFEVFATTERSQIASMVLRPGQNSGEYGSEHPESDQILYVIEGLGVAIIEGEERQIGPGDIVLIEAHEQHQIRGMDDSPLRTLNIYSPPAYT